ncbi:WD-40 repeat-containing protein [Nitzschia inconspicua]|uniref:Pre-mRNA-processing factor 19 n=1 Tax=Nitzschia inconspicua TaxID=303405 RepID=A0A9K3PMT5_9STRA|nr:WD-40 repeat-containing protein [Nitzschia inconspicua]
MPFTCEISGESLASTADEVVVTPSGHICIKRLLLTKLAENGGVDPFETIRELPLTEDQLVTLAKPSQPQGGQAPAIAPPRPQATSLPNMLHLVQKEYDALVLELFDTRKALEDTRRELSQALYQNDAAVRVVARLAQERDAARQELERWDASVGKSGGNGVKRLEPSSQEEADEPEPKRRRLDPSADPLSNDIPADDFEMISDECGKLMANRKAILKAGAAEAPSQEDLSKFAEIDTKAWHKSTNKGIPCMAQTRGPESNLIATAGKDKQLVVYNQEDQVILHTFPFGSVGTSIDISTEMVAAGDAKGKVAVFALGEDAGLSGELALGARVVGLGILPTKQHICAATSDGRFVLACWVAEEKRLQHISTFTSDEEEKEDYTCGALHPDGLLYVIGNKSGASLFWDFKNKKLAAVLKDGEESDPVTAVAFSNNGYHVAVAHESAAVKFWDLRKQKLVATIKDELDSVTALVFDKGGKYAAMGGKGGIKITTVKEWGISASLENKNPPSGIVWTKGTVAVSSGNERAVHFFGVPP